MKAALWQVTLLYVVVCRILFVSELIFGHTIHEFELEGFYWLQMRLFIDRLFLQATVIFSCQKNVMDMVKGLSKLYSY